MGNTKNIIAILIYVCIDDLSIVPSISKLYVPKKIMINWLVLPMLPISKTHNINNFLFEYMISFIDKFLNSSKFMSFLISVLSLKFVICIAKITIIPMTPPKRNASFHIYNRK